MLSDFIPIVDKWLEEDRKAPGKQRHTAMRIYHRLCDKRGFTGCCSTVKKYVRKKKFVMKTMSAGYLPLGHPHGWGRYTLPCGRRMGRCRGTLPVLCADYLFPQI